MNSVCFAKSCTRIALYHTEEVLARVVALYNFIAGWWDNCSINKTTAQGAIAGAVLYEPRRAAHVQNVFWIGSILPRSPAKVLLRLVQWKKGIIHQLRNGRCFYCTISPCVLPGKRSFCNHTRSRIRSVLSERSQRLFAVFLRAHARCLFLHE